MGTPFGIDIRLQNFSRATDDLAFNLMKLLSECYVEHKLELGNNGIDKIKDREVFYTVVDSEFENVFLYFKYRDVDVGSPYQIVLESRGSDSPSELKIHIDDTLLDNLPREMIKNLEEEFFKFTS